jgi:protein-disulfide isomerase
VMRPMNTRSRRIVILSTLMGLLAAAVVIAVVTSGGGDDKTTKTPTVATATPGAENPLEAQFKGIAQDNFTMGNGPATLEEFVDPQCPFCAELSRKASATLVANYVKPGRVKVVLRPIAFLGDDSVTAAKMFAAAALQGKAWQYAEVFYANQGEENSGYVTDKFLRQVGEQVPGLDVEKALTDRNSPQARALLADASKRAHALFKDGLSTPSLVLTQPGGKPKKLQLEALNAAALSKALDSAL